MWARCGRKGGWSAVLPRRSRVASSEAALCDARVEARLPGHLCQGCASVSAAAAALYRGAALGSRREAALKAGGLWRVLVRRMVSVGWWWKGGVCTGLSRRQRAASIVAVLCDAREGARQNAHLSQRCMRVSGERREDAAVPVGNSLRSASDGECCVCAVGNVQDCVWPRSVRPACRLV